MKDVHEQSYETATVSIRNAKNTEEALLLTYEVIGLALFLIGLIVISKFKTQNSHSTDGK